MALFRKLFYRKPPDGLLEICDRVYVFDCCFTTEAMEQQDYKGYVGGIITQLREHYPDTSLLVFNFREGETHSHMANALGEYDMTIMEYPRQYEGCPLLPMEVIHHFLRSSESWLSLGLQNVLLMHCERGGWPVMAFMLAALLIYRKQYSGELKTLEMVYKQAPRELLQLLSRLNPIPSQLRYLQYVSRRNVGNEWPPLDRALTMDCVIIRMIPNFDGQGGCRPVFRIYGQDPFLVSDRTPKVLFSTPKKSRTVRYYKQVECELVKIDINCHIQGDVVLECISLRDDMEREEMMFRVMFNTAFIRSNILMLNRDDVDILWDAKDLFPKDFRVEVIFSEMDTASSIIPLEYPCFEEKDGLPVEAFSKVQEMFSSVDWLSPKGETTAAEVLQHLTASNTLIEAYSQLHVNNQSLAALEHGANSPPVLTSPNQSTPTGLGVIISPEQSLAPLGDHSPPSSTSPVHQITIAKSSPLSPTQQSDPITQQGNVAKEGFPLIEAEKSQPKGAPSTPLTQPIDVVADVGHGRPVPSPVTLRSPLTPLLEDKIGFQRERPSVPISPKDVPSTPPTEPRKDADVGSGRPVSSPVILRPPLTPPLVDNKGVQKKIPSVSTEAVPVTPPTQPTKDSVSSPVMLRPPLTPPLEDKIGVYREIPSVSISHKAVPSTPTQPTKDADIGSGQPTTTLRPPLTPPLEDKTSFQKEMPSVSTSALKDGTTTRPVVPSAQSSKSYDTVIRDGPSKSEPSSTEDVVEAAKVATCPPSTPTHSSSTVDAAKFTTAGPPTPPIGEPSLPPHLSSPKREEFTPKVPSPPSPPNLYPTPVKESSASTFVPAPPSITPLKENSACEVAPLPTPPNSHMTVSSARTPPPPPPPPPIVPSDESPSFSGRISPLPPPVAPPPPPPPPVAPPPPARVAPPPPPPPPMAPPPPPPVPPLKENSTSGIVPPPPLTPPVKDNSVMITAPRPPPPPPPSGLANPSTLSPPVPPPAPVSIGSNTRNPPSVPSPPPPGGLSGSLSPPPPSAPPPGAKGKSILSRSVTSRNNQTKKLKPLHWLKLSRAVSGSLWAETQKSGEAIKVPEIDISELETLFSASAPNPDQGGRKAVSRASMANKPEKVQLVDHRRAYNCEIMLSKVKIPLPDLLSSVLSLEDSALDVDQVDNLIKFCPTKEEMELLKGYKGERDNLGKCEQFFMELMQVPRIESKLRVFSFKIQFHSQVSDLRKSLNVVNSAADQIRGSSKLKRVMQTILSLGSFEPGNCERLDSLLKLTETRARNNKMTLMHYLCKVLSDKLPELLDFWQDLSSLEPAVKIQLKYLAEEMQAINKGLEKVVQELSMSENDGPVSDQFRKALKEFLCFSEGEVRSLASLYSGVGRNVDALILYFGEDPSRCPFEQVISTLLNFVKMFKKALEENSKQLEFERKKAEKEASENQKLSGGASDTSHLIESQIRRVK